MGNSIHFNPADFEDDETPDPHGDRHVYLNAVREMAARSSVTFREVEPGEVLMSIRNTAADMGFIFGLVLSGGPSGEETLERLERLLNIARAFEKNILDTINGSIEQGELTITLNADEISQRNLASIQHVSFQVRSIISAAIHCLEYRIREGR